MHCKCIPCTRLSQEGLTPLIAASSEGRLDIVELLLADGARIEAADEVREMR